MRPLAILLASLVFFPANLLLAASSNPGVYDICYSAAVGESHGLPSESFWRGPTFIACEQKKITKASCNISSNRSFVGALTYSFGAVRKVINRCDPEPSLSEIQSHAITGVNLQGIVPTTPEGQGRMVGMYTDSLGVSAVEAQRIVQNDPQSALDLLNDIADGNTGTAEAEQLANQFGIDPNVLSGRIGQLQPIDSLLMQEAPQGQESWNNLPVQCGSPGIAGNLMLAESSCGTNVINPKSSSVHGPFQYKCPTWTTYAVSTGNSQYASCDWANDKPIATKVTAEYYDQLAPRIEPQCEAAGVTMTSCIYTYHWLGGPTFNKVVNAIPSLDQNAPATSLCGSVISSAVCNDNPGFFKSHGQPLTVAGMFSHMDASSLGGGGASVPVNLAPAYAVQIAPPLPVPAPTAPLYAASLGNGSTPGSYAAGYVPNNALQTQFAGMMLVSSFMGPMQGLVNSFAASLGRSFSKPQEPPQPPPPPPPAASISALPNPVARGQNISVSWSSDGTSLKEVCEVKDQNGMLVGRGDGGSEVLPTGSSTPSTLTYTVYCTGVNGQSIRQSATVTVE